MCRVSGSLEGPRPVSRTSGRGRSPSPSLRTRRGRALRAVSCQTNVSQESASERPSVNVPSLLALPVRSGFEGCQRRSCRSYSSGADKHHKYARFEQVLKSTDIIPISLSALTRAPPLFFLLWRIIICSRGWFGGIFMMMFSHWGSLVSESCIYFKSKSLERSFRYFKYSRWIIVSYSFFSPVLAFSKKKKKLCSGEEDLDAVHQLRRSLGLHTHTPPGVRPFPQGGAVSQVGSGESCNRSHTSSYEIRTCVQWGHCQTSVGKKQF